MRSNSISNNGINKTSGPSNKAQDKSTVNISNLLKQLDEAQKYLAYIRQIQSNNTSTINNSNEGISNRNNNSNINAVYAQREWKSLSQIYDIKGKLEDAGVRNGSPQIENNNFVSGQSLGGFESFLQGVGNNFNSALSSIGNKFNSFTDAVGNSLKAVGVAATNAKNWFVSQIPGPTNVNEDGGKNNGNCWAAALETVYRLRGGKDKDTKTPDGNAQTANSDIERWRQNIGLMNEGKGATPEQIAKAAKRGGMNAKSTTGSLSDAASGTKEGKYYILAVDPSKYKSGLKPSGHAVVLLGIDPTSGTATIADPAEQNPTQVKIADLQKAMDTMGNKMVKIS